MNTDRERSNSNVMGTDPIAGRERVSTERKNDKVSTEPPGILRENSVTSSTVVSGGLAARKWNTDIPVILPHERVFPIQIGSELFRLSGASISSDGMWLIRLSCVYITPDLDCLAVWEAMGWPEIMIY